MENKTRVLVTGAGGFIGSHLVTFLKKRGYWVRGVDLKYPEFGETDADEFEILDLRRWDACLQASRNVEEVYALAAFGLLFAIASVTLAEGAKRVPSGQTALLSALETPLAPIFAFMLFAEIPGIATLLGGSVVLFAVLFSMRNEA